MRGAGETVVVAMSGGVDSSVAAALLHEQGYRVVGVTMNLWDYDSAGGNLNRDSGCCSLDTMADARAVCHTLGVPHYVINFRYEFEEAVTANFIAEYLEGRTPNPCVRCNTYLKWGSLLGKALEIGADKIATGHYARIRYHETNRRFSLLRGIDTNKDQTYALWGIRQAGLARTLFPIGELTKPEVREVARQLGLKTAEKQESQEICFITDNDYSRYLREKVPALAAKVAHGSVIDTEGNMVGHHDGYPFYTIGQRKGLGLALGRPVYVTTIDPVTNTIVVGDNENLMHRGLLANNINWLSVAGIEGQKRVFTKIRYKDSGAEAVIEQAGKEVQVIFDSPQRAVTPGQSVVFYDGEVVLGGGIIQKALDKENHAHV